MSDRELLELAAEAAGIEVHRIIPAHPDDEIPLTIIIREPDDGLRRWNPLEDDGDALRLAMTLYAKHGVSVVFNQDSAAVARRAIVKAAAGIAAEKRKTQELEYLEIPRHLRRGDD